MVYIISYIWRYTRGCQGQHKSNPWPDASVHSGSSADEVAGPALSSETQVCQSGNECL